MTGGVLVGFGQVLLISLVPVVIAGAFVHAFRFLEHARTVGRRLRLLPPEPPQPHGPPFEHLVDTLRRLAPHVRSPRPGVAATRQRGMVAAYDEALVNAAAALEVTTNLLELPEGLDYECERLRLEHELEAAGLVWKAPQT